MGKFPNPSTFNTPIIIKKPIEGEKNEDGFAPENYATVFDEPIYCEWENFHGNAVFSADSLDWKDPATLKIRYSPKITRDCIVFKPEDDKPFSIESLDDIREMHLFLELKIKRYTKK